jgi:hypothetical protein
VPERGMLLSIVWANFALHYVEYSVWLTQRARSVPHAHRD